MARWRLLEIVTLLAVALVEITELLGAFESIRRGPLAIAWLIVAGVGAVVFALRRPRLRIAPFRFDPVLALCVAGGVVILGITALTAFLSPPNLPHTVTATALRRVRDAACLLSRRCRPPVDAEPCMIVCLDCAGDTAPLNSYREFGNSAVLGKFVVLSKLSEAPPAR